MPEILKISEQYVRRQIDLEEPVAELLRSCMYRRIAFKHIPEMACFQLEIEDEAPRLTTNYFVGLDWIISEKLAVYVAPKLDGTQEVDIASMLLQSLEDPENLHHLDILYHAKFDEPWIEINNKRSDLLSPILIVQFLKLLQVIVRKGLKRSYYRVMENLDSRIKGKILIGQQVKRNISRNRMTKTVCNFQEYGVNTKENQFFKLVLTFVSSYLEQPQPFFSGRQLTDLRHILAYCSPAFENVSMPESAHRPLKMVKNPFYREYEKAIEIGNYILKRYSFNISRISETRISSPPFWINMSQLFELYVFRKLRYLFSAPGAVTYHDKYLGGKETDLLLKVDGYKCVIDCKYKPHYQDHRPSTDDIRQLIGYTRMTSVYNKLGMPHHIIIKGMIVYSHQDCSNEINKERLQEAEVISGYIDLVKLGISLPTR